MNENTVKNNEVGSHQNYNAYQADDLVHVFANGSAEPEVPR